MKNKGYLISLDTEKWKLEELRKRFRRNGISIIEPRWIENNKVIKRLVNSCDRLLLDVPCSGLGVVKEILMRNEIDSRIHSTNKKHNKKFYNNIVKCCGQEVKWCMLLAVFYLLKIKIK